MSAAAKLFEGADPVWGYLRREQLEEMFDVVEEAARQARDELLDATDEIPEDATTNVLYALGEIQKIVRSAADARGRLECSATKALAATMVLNDVTSETEVSS
ncbi:MAG TPA: hypothetical protein VHC69_14370 [Polyangiaceae bacterium]|nr:hypothetical protein [Polyangiaceae bacterium]